MRDKRIYRYFGKGFFLLAVLLISVTGCKKGDTAQTDATQTEEAVKEDSVAFEVGDIKVSYNEVMMYVFHLKSEYEPKIDDVIWDYQFLDGNTFESIAKDEVLNQIAQIKIIGKQAEELEAALTADEKAQVVEMAAEKLDEIRTEDLERFHITQSLMEQIYEDNYLAEKIFEIVTNDVDTNVPDEDARQIQIQQLYISTVKKDADGKEKQVSKAEKKEALKRAKSCLKKAKKEIKKENGFKSFAELNTDDIGVEVTIGRGEKEKLYEEAAFSLKTGKLSDIIEEKDGYYILYCVNDFDKDATAEKKEEIIKNRQDKAFSDIYEKWSKDNPVKINAEIWNKVSFK